MREAGGGLPQYETSQKRATGYNYTRLKRGHTLDARTSQFQPLTLNFIFPFGLVFFLVSFYLTTWSPTSCGPPETSPRSTPDLAAAGVRSDPPPSRAEESRCCARCWSHGPTAASIRSECRTGQPWRCAATTSSSSRGQDVCRVNGEPRTAHSTNTPTNSSGQKKKVSRVIRLKRRGKKNRTPPRNTLRHTSSWGSCEGLQTLVRNLRGEKNPQDSICLFCGTRFLMRGHGGVKASYTQLRSGCELKVTLYRQFKVIRWQKAHIRPDRVESGTGRVISLRRAAKFIITPHATGLLAYRGNTAHPEKGGTWKQYRKHRKTKQKVAQAITFNSWPRSRKQSVLKSSKTKNPRGAKLKKMTELRK